jgi:DNA invertase Pin-like site-specific DNA recombinase
MTSPRPTGPTPTTTPAAQPRRAVIYLRVASSHPEDQATVDRQREACQELARRYDLTVTGEYVDLGRSGWSRERRGLQRLLTDLGGAAPANYVIVDRVQRLSRNVEQHVRLQAALARSGADVLCADEADSSLTQNRALSATKLIVAASYLRDRPSGGRS